MTFALLGSPTRTNLELTYAWRRLGIDARVLWAREASQLLRPGDTALLRLDVVPTLDGIEPGLELVPELAERGIRILNSPQALLATHDKLLTTERLESARIPHPWTAHVEPGRSVGVVPFPCVLKPRFGSWGQDVYLCRTLEDLRGLLEQVQSRPWWRAHGALLQAFIPTDRDVRVVVAGGQAVAGAQRIAAPGEWRTNMTLGGRVVEAKLPREAELMATRAAAALGVDFAGVDLLPVDGRWLVLELNGAVDFDTRYALPGVDPYAAILDQLGIPREKMREDAERGTLVETQRREVAMAKTVHGKPARPGDEVLITGHSVGIGPRTAVIREVLGEPGHERFRVEWEDGHESILYPGEDAVVRRPTKRRAKAAS